MRIAPITRCDLKMVRVAATTRCDLKILRSAEPSLCALVPEQSFDDDVYLEWLKDAIEFAHLWGRAQRGGF